MYKKRQWLENKLLSQGKGLIWKSWEPHRLLPTPKVWVLGRLEAQRYIGIRGRHIQRAGRIMDVLSAALIGLRTSTAHWSPRFCMYRRRKGPVSKFVSQAYLIAVECGTTERALFWDNYGRQQLACFLQRRNESWSKAIFLGGQSALMSSTHWETLAIPTISHLMCSLQS